MLHYDIIHKESKGLSGTEQKNGDLEGKRRSKAEGGGTGMNMEDEKLYRDGGKFKWSELSTVKSPEQF